VPGKRGLMDSEFPELWSVPKGHFAVSKNDLPWVEFKDEDSLGGMLGAGLPQEVAKNYVEMGTAVRSGKMFTDFELQGKPVSGKTKLEDFAKVFAVVYNN